MPLVWMKFSRTRSYWSKRHSSITQKVLQCGRNNRKCDRCTSIIIRKNNEVFLMSKYTLSELKDSKQKRRKLMVTPLVTLFKEGYIRWKCKRSSLSRCQHLTVLVKYYGAQSSALAECTSLQESCQWSLYASSCLCPHSLSSKVEPLGFCDEL